MAEHSKKTKWPKSAIITACVAGICLLASLVTGLLLASPGGLSQPANAQGEPELSETSREKTMADYPRTEPVRNMRAGRITPGVEYFTDEKDTPAVVRQQIDQALALVEEWEFNTILVDMEYGDKVLYPSQVYPTVSLTENGKAFDPLAYLIEKAHGKNLTVYATLNLRIGQKNGWDPALPDDRAQLRQAVDEAVAAYAVDGYFITHYGYPDRSALSLDACLTYRGDLGVVAYLQKQVDETVSYAVTAALKPGGRSVGLLADPVWATTKVSKEGVKASALSDYADGFADTRRWIEAGWFDSVMVDNAGSLEDKAVPFATILSWWDKLCEAQSLPLYVAHAADKAGGEETGWNSPDQLPRQFLACKEAKAWKGSVFGSVEALRKNTDKTTDVLLKAMAGTAKEEFLGDKLKITSLKDKETTTLESRMTLQGSADPNFPLLLNGKALEVSDHGFFAKDVTLKVGKNTFTFRHKGQKITYTVVYDIEVIKSIAPVRDLKLEGGTAITVSAIARKGAAVSAVIGNTTVNMHPVPLQMENGSEDLSDYENFSGTYVLPAGITGKVQALGAVVVRGEYQGLKKTMKGGRLFVAALQPPVTNLPEGGSSSNGNDTGILDPSKGGQTLKSGTILMVTAEYAETFRGSTVEDYSRPTNAYLAKGTTDVLVRKVYDSASEHYYYQMGSGRRVYMDDAAVYKTSGKLTANTLTGGKTGVDSDGTSITFGSVWKIPYNVQLLPQSYANINTTSQPSYDVSGTGQTTEYVDVTFYYTDTVPAAPDVSGSPLFRSAKWIRQDDHRYVLRLYLTRKAQFYGYSVRWESGGQMVLQFKHAPAVSDGDKPLKGIHILIDAGHGGSSVGTAAGTLAEKTLTLQYAKTLREKLQALGASVRMTRTGDTNPTVDARMNAARNNGTDLLISVHMDGSTSSSTSGCSVHYFNEYSYEPARQVVNRMREVEKTFGIGSRSKVLLWNPFFITRVSDMPSMLVECGFMSNPRNLEQLISSGYRSLLTQAIADGVVAYFKSLPAMSGTQTSQTQASGTQPTILTAPSTGISLSTAALPPDPRRIWNLVR